MAKKYLHQLILPFFLLFLIVHVHAQELETSKIEHGMLLSTRMDSDDDFSFKVKGYGVEGGYYFLKNLGRRGMISLDLRIAYGRSERDYVNLVEHNDFFILPDTIQTRLTGTAHYQNVSLALPIKFRYRLSAGGPVFLLVGFNPYFNLISNTSINYDLVEYNTVTKMNISAMTNLEGNIKQRLYSQDIMLAGIGYKKDNWMFDLYFSGGSTYFDHPFIGFMDKLSVVLNAYYKLK